MLVREMKHLVDSWIKNGFGDYEIQVYEPVIDKEYRPVLGFSYCENGKKMRFEPQSKALEELWAMEAEMIKDVEL